MKSKITIIEPNILDFRILFKRGGKKDFLGLTKIKYLFKLGLN
jgi:hypothetical protein